MCIIKAIKRKIISEECWNLDYELIKWLNSHLKVYKKEAGEKIDLDFHEFRYKGKKMTQIEVIDRLIEITDEFTRDFDYYNISGDGRIMEMIDEMYELLRMVHFSLWW